MWQSELLKYLVAALERENIPYMVTGSTVSSIQGNPRSTHDIDVVVAIAPAVASKIKSSFPEQRFYLDEDSIKDAIKHFGEFNALDMESGGKIDFWVLKPDAFHQSMFKRRYKEVAAGIEMYISQPEDTILSKLQWAKDCGGSEKQMQDCIAVYEVNLTNLDMDYLDRWSMELKVGDLLARVKRESRSATRRFMESDS